MDRTSWNTGGRLSSTSEVPAWESQDVEFWKSVLADSRVRSRVLRDLELQSIGSRSLEDHIRSSRDEELELLGSAAARQF